MDFCFFKIDSLRKTISDKYIALYHSYYSFEHKKGGSKNKHFNIPSNFCVVFFLNWSFLWVIDGPLK
jgi:hypothetical protein